MSKRVSLSGNEAVALAMKQINPDVVAAYPITPSTEIPQYFSQYVANGEVDTEFVPVESEHSAMSTCIGASAAGGRVMTATSANGLALMWEMLYIAASDRLPIVLAAVNRALSGPINIHNDHSDTMGARDAGWIQLYSENAQEAYDNFIQAVRIAEHSDVQLPVMVCFDGFITSHSVENLTVLEEPDVKGFVGADRVAPYALLDQEPVSFGPLDMPPYYFEHKRQQAHAMENAKQVILDAAALYERISGRKYGLFEQFMMEDAEAAMVIINSTAGTAKAAVTKMRKAGKKVGLIKIRSYRPFPAEELAKALSKVKAVAVMDKSDSFSTAGGPLFTEVRSALYGRADNKAVLSYIYGLGGRDVTVESMEKVYGDLFEAMNGAGYSVCNYLGVKE